MKSFTLAGVRRGDRFSPNHVGNDAAIFALTAHHLRQAGYTVNEYTESDLVTQTIHEPVVFNMVRDHTSVRCLQELEQGGSLVINSGFGIENCTRERMTRLLMSNHIPHPESLIVSTHSNPEEALTQAGFRNCWIKRGDFHAIHREDVTYVRNPEEAKSILREYALRHIPNAVINEHLVGDLVKFYGVTGTDFFYWFYPSSTHHSKFGLELINGSAKGIPFDEADLRNICNAAANVLDVHIYGGDCIVSEEGTIRLIDFNDWPSFAPCREEAAPYIAQRIEQLIENRQTAQL